MKELKDCLFLCCIIGIIAMMFIKVSLDFTEEHQGEQHWSRWSDPIQSREDWGITYQFSTNFMTGEIKVRQLTP